MAIPTSYRIGAFWTRPLKQAAVLPPPLQLHVLAAVLQHPLQRQLAAAVLQRQVSAVVLQRQLCPVPIAF